MSIEKKSEPPRTRAFQGRVAVLAVVTLATLSSVADAKVIWDGARAPLFRAERLARQQSFIVRRSLAPFMPYLATPYPLWVPAFGAGWIWAGDTATPFVRACDDE